MIKTLFLIGSALHTKHGVYSAEQRLEQTINTLKSVKDKIPDAQIILSESSGESSITEEESAILKPYLLGLINYNTDIQVQQIYKSTDNWDVVKSYTELLVTGKTLDFVVSRPKLLENIDRVFKLSGRYFLSDGFSVETFEHRNKYMFAARRNSQFPAQVTGGLNFQFMSRLWSWPADRTALVFYRYNLMLEEFSSALEIGQYKDIEHLLFRYFGNHPNTLELSKIGVSGNLGPNGIKVTD
jgi:hypothetical protein